MPDCQEASEIKKKLEILDRHLQLDMMIFCSRRAEGIAFLMVLRFREANRKIILLGCDVTHLENEHGSAQKSPN